MQAEAGAAIRCLDGPDCYEAQVFKQVIGDEADLADRAPEPVNEAGRRGFDAVGGGAVSQAGRQGVQLANDCRV